MFGRRPDATLVQNLSPMRRFMPMISPRRNDSLFYMMQEIEVDAALAYLERRNASRPPERPITLFHLFVRACTLALHLRPGVNRFVKGGRLWQRDGIWLTFSAKREIVDGSPLLTVKRRFHPERESLEEMVDGVYESLARRRGGERDQSDREVGLLLRLPPFVVKPILFLNDKLDDWGLLPRSMLDSDPLCASIFLANLGSINYPAGFHHLWEHGTTSIFGVMGRIENQPGKPRYMNAAWTYDERIEDGLYSYYTLQSIKERIERPEQLDADIETLVERERERIQSR
jgi:pyruvate/2-oxoglutarate dehydrogenase complex dihydrolipoamide acyltransferase (E2) component